MTVWRLLPPLLLLAACTGGRTGAPAATPPPDDTERLVRQAEAQVQAGAHAEAARLFEEVSRNPNSPFAARALLGLTRTLCSPEYAGRDYRLAYLVADRLQREHPDSPYAAEARAWRDLLGSYLTREQELERRTQELDQSARELERRAQELERLKHLDQELERRTRELAERTQELERLKRLDQELERLTHQLAQELERRTQELERLKRLDLELEKKKKP